MPRSLLDVGVVSAAAITAWFGFAAWATYGILVQGHVHLYAENGLIESLQAGLAAVACVIYLATVAFEKRPDRLLLLFCALLCYAFFVREVDVETFDVPRALVLIASGKGRTLSLAVAVAAICLYAALTDAARYAKAAVQFLRSRPGVLLMAGGVFLVIGELAEKTPLIPQHVFVEEMAELLGYVLILLSSISANAYLSGMSIRSLRSGGARG